MPLLKINMDEIMKLGSKLKGRDEDVLGIGEFKYGNETEPTQLPYYMRSDVLSLYSGDDYFSEISDFLDSRNLTYHARSEILRRAEKAIILNGIEPLANLKLNLNHYLSQEKDIVKLPLYHSLSIYESLDKISWLPLSLLFIF